MSAKCPNKSNPEWKLMVRLFNEDNAFYLYDANDEEIPSFELISEVFKQNYKKNIPDALLQEYLKEVNAGTEQITSKVSSEKQPEEAVSIRNAIFDSTSDQDLLNAEFSTNALLEDLMKGGYIPEALRAFPSILTLDTKFIFVKEFEDKTTYMTFSQNDDIIRFSVENLKKYWDNKEQFSRSLLHELFHLYTARALDHPANDQERWFATEMTKLYNEAIANQPMIRQFFAKAKLVNKFYGFENVKEFTSEIMTNGKFRNHVFKNDPGLFKRIMNALIRLFTGKPIASKQGRDVLAESMQIILEQVELVNSTYDRETKISKVLFIEDQIEYYESEIARLEQGGEKNYDSLDELYAKLNSAYESRKDVTSTLASKVPNTGGLWESLRKSNKITEDSKYYINRDGNRELLTDTHNPDVWEIKNKEKLVENEYVKGDIYPLKKKPAKFLIKTVGKKLAYLRNKYTGATFSTANVAQAYTHINVSVPLSDRVLEQRVDYRLKSVNILLSDKAKQVFAKGNKNGWSLDKILTELAIPKEQKVLLLELNSKIHTVWHASDKPIDKFIKENVNNYFVKTKGGSPRAVFFTANKSPEESFLSKREYHKQFSVKMENPFIADYSENPQGEFNGKNREQIVREALENGHDGVIWKNIYDNGFVGDVYISLNADNISSDLREQLALELASKYSYSVEVNIAKSKDSTKYTDYGDITEVDNPEYNEERDTQHYSNLTVPGGTNYTENEISTPLITPSIKGHAQFATDNGIGWFRSDEQATASTYKFGNFEIEETKEGKYILKDTDKNIIIDTYDDVDEAQNYIINYRQNFVSGVATKTRRILEVQSDLFQKGREDKYLDKNAAKDIIISIGENVLPYIDQGYYVADRDDKIIVLKKNNLGDTKENKFLQLLNKDSNWVTFFIKSIIQDSAKKGYEKVLFPKGETAAKVEGHEILAVEIITINDNLEALNENKIVERNNIGYPPDYQIINKKGEIVIGEISKRTLEIIRQEKIVELEKRKEQLKTQGIEKLKPIEAFYEIKVGNVLKKNYTVKEVTDEYGNTWNEITIDPKKHLGSIELQRRSNNKPEKLSRYELKKQKLLKAFPRVQEIIEDENLPVLGQIEQSGRVIRVNPTLMKEDTIGHEFGHLLLVLLGGMNNPLVQRAYRHLEGTPLAEQVRREYADQSEMTIQLEILAQAIGEESIDFDNIQDEIAREEAKNMWQKMLMKIFERLKALLHIDKGAVRELTKLLYTGVEDTGITFDEVYEQRKSRDGKENTEKPVGGRSLELPDYINKLNERTTSIEKLLIKAKDILYNKRAIYERHNNVVAINSIDSTLKAMEEGTDTITSLMRFVSTAATQIDNVYDKYYIDAKNAFNAGDKEAVSVKDLNRWLNYVIAFDSLEPIRLSIIETVGRGKFAEMGELKNLLDNAITKKNDIKSFYIEAGKTLIADRLSGLSTRVESTFKLLFERKWKTLSKEEKGDLTMEEYINKNVEASKEDIGTRTNKLLLDQLDEASFDISYIARLADNLLDSDDVVVASLVKMVVEALDKARLEGLEYRDQMIDMVRELEKVQKNSLLTNPEDFYAFAIETDEKGNKKNHLIHKMRSSFFEDYRAYSDLLETEEGQKLVDDRRSWLNRWQRSFTDDEVRKLMRTEWKELNAPLDRESFKKAKWAMLSSMLESNKITPEEFEILKADEQYKEFKDTFLLLDTNESAATEISNWIYENVWLFRSPIDKYRNPQWEQLQKMRKAGIKNGVQTDARINFYDFILTSNAKADKWLPRSFRLYTKLPSVAKDTVERLKTGKDIGASMSETIKHTFNVRPYDTERGEMSGTETLELKDETGKPKMFLPVYYSGNIDIKDQSFDLGTIYLNRYKMAVEYKNKYEILPEVELTKFLVENRDVIRTDSNNNPIKSVNKKLTNRELTKSGKNSLIAAQLEDWLKTVFYDKAAEDEGTVTIPLFDVEVDKAKILDALNRYTSLNLLGLNVVQGTANIALGETMQIAEAFAGENYTMKNYRKASRYYSSRFWGIAGDIGQRKPSNIISILLEQMNILNDYEDPTNLRKSTVFRQLITTDSLFFIAHSGEHMMQARAMLAVLDFTKAKDKDGKVIKNEKGKELSLLDVLEVKDGKINTKHGAVFTTEQMLTISNKIKRMLARMHGEYSKAGKVALQRYALGRMVYMFRKFIYMGHKRRWETGNRVDKDGSILYKYNELSESFTEGAYISFYRFSKKFLADVFKFKFKLAKMHYAEMDSIERANVHRTLTELSFAVTLLAASTLLLNLKGDEDDDDKKFFYNHLLYQTLRLRTELAFFINPIQAWTILKSPAASMSIVENLFRLLNILLNPFDDDWINGKFETGPWKGHYKFEKYTVNMTPVIKQYFRIRDVDTLIGQFK